MFESTIHYLAKKANYVGEYDFKSVIKYLKIGSVTLIAKICTFSVYKNAVDSYREINSDYNSQDIRRRRRALSRIFKISSLFIFISVWFLIIASCMMQLDSATDTIKSCLTINKTDATTLFTDILVVLIYTTTAVSSFLLPANIIKIALFVLLISFTIYLIYGASFISNRLKAFSAILVGVFAFLGFTFISEKVDPYVAKVQKAIKGLVKHNKIAIPAFLCSSFIVSIQTVFIAAILSKIETRFIYILPVVLLSDWSYNVINNSNTVFISTFLYQANKNEQDWKVSAKIVYINFPDIIYRSLLSSFFTFLNNTIVIIKFLDGERGYMTTSLEFSIQFLQSLIEIREFIMDEMFFDMGMESLEKLQNKKNDNTENQYSNLTSSNANVHINEPELTDCKKEECQQCLKNSNEVLIMYLLRFKSLAFRIPILLNVLTFFKMGRIASAFVKSSGISCIEKPILFIEMVSTQRSLSSVIGMTCYLAITFYILSIPISYFANERYEKELSGEKVLERERTIVNATIDLATSTIKKAKNKFYSVFSTPSDKDAEEQVPKNVL